MFAAASLAEAVTDSADLQRRLVEADIKVALWQVLALLPPDLPLHCDDRPVDCLAALRSAVSELRSQPIADYPAGTSALLADLVGVTAAVEAHLGDSR